MEIAQIVFNQVLVMFLLLIVGFLVVRFGVISKKTNRAMCDLLLKIIIPATIINSFLQPLSAESTMQLGLAFLLALIYHILCVVLVKVILPKKRSQDFRIDQLGAVYSNCGFMGLPLISALFGERGVFFASAYIAIFNIFVWIHGVKTIEPHQKMNLRKIIINPGVLMVIIGVLTYFLQIPYPAVLRQTISHMAVVNTPVAMMIIGGFFVSIKIKESLKEYRNVLISVVRTIILPLIFIGVLFVMGATRWSDANQVVVLTIVVAAACPTAATVVILPESMGIDSKHGVKVLAISTIMSIVTLPLIALIAGHLF